MSTCSFVCVLFRRHESFVSLSFWFENCRRPFRTRQNRTLLPILRDEIQCKVLESVQEFLSCRDDLFLGKKESVPSSVPQLDRVDVGNLGYSVSPVISSSSCCICCLGHRTTMYKRIGMKKGETKGMSVSGEKERVQCVSWTEERKIRERKWMEFTIDRTRKGMRCPIQDKKGHMLLKWKRGARISLSYECFSCPSCLAVYHRHFF